MLRESCKNFAVEIHQEKVNIVFCMDIDAQRGVKKCCKCNQWNVQGNDWTEDADFR